ncbi:hypothetical protein DFP72DRAFT_885109 [Ephemerocybe angulata]|uniref:NTF2 domain-containing protein n=1 Tax=Ephemerocybe angulata TaxID=980116 RepID=A0A8H6I7P7_9AGAR|nr:hypothetical protein DFP72DRAFT_885109 [Tulosesus angulatus]
MPRCSSLRQYGTAYTGNIEKEDVQPNEALRRTRKQGPPSVKVVPTYQPNRVQRGRYENNWKGPRFNMTNSPAPSWAHPNIYPSSANPNKRPNQQEQPGPSSEYPPRKRQKNTTQPQPQPSRLHDNGWSSWKHNSGEGSSSASNPIMSSGPIPPIPPSNHPPVSHPLPPKPVTFKAPARGFSPAQPIAPQRYPPQPTTTPLSGPSASANPTRGKKPPLFTPSGPNSKLSHPPSPLIIHPVQSPSQTPSTSALGVPHPERELSVPTWETWNPSPPRRSPRDEPVVKPDSPEQNRSNNTFPPIPPPLPSRPRSQLWTKPHEKAQSELQEPPGSPRTSQSSRISSDLMNSAPVTLNLPPNAIAGRSTLTPQKPVKREPILTPPKPASPSLSLSTAKQHQVLQSPPPETSLSGGASLERPGSMSHKQPVPAIAGPSNLTPQRPVKREPIPTPSKPPSSSTEKQTPPSPHVKPEPVPSPSQPSLSLPAHPSTVKQEPPATPSSEFQPERKLVKSACKRFSLPPECQKLLNPGGWQTARRAFWQEKVGWLRAKGVTVGKKALYREDGMVLEWESTIPLWSDTLRPYEGDLAIALTQSSSWNAELGAATERRSRTKSRTPLTPLRTGAKVAAAPSMDSDASSSMSMVSTGSAASASGSASNMNMNTPLLPVRSQKPPPPPPPPRMMRPSQVVPPNAHPPKRTFKPVHVPRSVPEAPVPVPVPAPSRLLSTEELIRKAPPLPRRPPIGEGNRGPARRISPATTAVAPAAVSPVQEEVKGLVVSRQTPPEALFVEASVLPRQTPPEVPSCIQVKTEEGEVAPTQTFPDAPFPLQVKNEEDEVASSLLTDLPTIDAGMPENAPTAQEDEGSSSGEDSGTDTDILDLAVTFLQKYIETFDGDRAQLAGAYSPDATFSAGIHEPESDMAVAELFCPPERIGEARARILHQGREAIMARFGQLGPHKFMNTRVAEGRSGPIYDAVILPEDDFGEGERALVNIHSEAVNSTKVGKSVVVDHVVSVDQCFILRARRDMGRSGEGDGWPLEVVSHQMVVRDGPMVRWDDGSREGGRLEDVFPWIREALRKEAEARRREESEVGSP